MNFMNMTSSIPPVPDVNFEETLEKTSFIHDGITSNIKNIDRSRLCENMFDFYQNSLTLLGYICAMFMTHDDIHQTASELVDIVIDLDKGVTKIVHRHDDSPIDCLSKIRNALKGALDDLNLHISGRPVSMPRRMVSQIIYDVKSTSGEGRVDL